MATVTDIRVRFCETDAVGHVNNVSYFIYLEEARVDFTKQIGLSLETKDVTMAVVSLHCDFIAQAYFDQVIQVETAVAKIGRKSFTLVHDIRDKESQTLIARGESVVVWLNGEKNKAIPLDDDFIEKLEAHRLKDASES